MESVFTEYVPIPNTLDSNLMKGFWGTVGVVIGAPIAEELLFRGAILGNLLKTQKPWTAIVASALIFGIIHFNPAQVFGATLMGLFMGWLFYRTGSIWAPILAHFINNGVCTLLVNYIPDYEKMPLEQLIGGNINIVIGSIVSFIIFYLSIKALNLKLPKVDNQESMAHEGINEIAITYKEQKR